MMKQQDKKVGEVYLQKMYATLDERKQQRLKNSDCAVVWGSLPQGLGGVLAECKPLSALQVAELERIQKACRNIVKLCNGINQSSVANELDLPKVEMYELAWFLDALDKRVQGAKLAAKKMGVPDVLPRRSEVV